jgi:hypothetical protein
MFYYYSCVTTLFVVSFVASVALCPLSAASADPPPPDTVDEARIAKKLNEAVGEFGLASETVYSKPGDVRYAVQLGRQADASLLSLGAQDHLLRARIVELTLRVDIESDVSKKGFTALEKLTNLEHFHFRGKWQDEWNFIFGRLPKLRSVWIQNGGLTGKALEKIADASNLECLMLDGNEFESQRLDSLARLKNLQQLSLSSKSITDKDLAFLHKTTKLKNLYLIGTSITDGAVETLRDCAELELLQVAETGITEKGLLELRKNLPKAIVIGGL